MKVMLYFEKSKLYNYISAFPSLIAQDIVAELTYMDICYCQNLIAYAILLMKQGRCEVRVASLNNNAHTDQPLS
jgi:hypothetical protein